MTESGASILSNTAAPGELELRRVERLLHQMVPEESRSWAHLLNALLVEAERPQVHEPVLKPIKKALFTLIGGVAASRLRKPLSALLQAARLPTDTNPKGLDEKGNTVSYSLGDGAIDEIAYLRFDLGLSALYVCRHMRDSHGVPTPPAALLAMIAGVDERPPPDPVTMDGVY